MGLGKDWMQDFGVGKPVFEVFCLFILISEALARRESFGKVKCGWNFFLKGWKPGCKRAKHMTIWQYEKLV